MVHVDIEPAEAEVAIIGMACRVAGADSPSKLWDVLATSKDVQKDITRFNGDGFYAPDGGPRKGLTNVKRSYFIDGEVSEFDNAFFSIPPLEANAMDPQQRLLLEVTYEAVENAGIPLENFRGSNTAVFAATTSGDYATNTLRDLDSTQKYTSTGTSNAILANRLSYSFDLHGPSLLIDTACSSTMVALHYAVAALKSGEASMALVSGVNLMLNPDMFVHMSELGFLSPSGRCRSFDAAGDGYARAEGVLSLLLKPLHQARLDGDPIRAVIKGTRLNHNGRTQGITLPSTKEQKANLEALYESFNLDPADIQYFEAHGTGTAAGDPIELAAVDSVFGASHSLQKLVVGSVKSNIGHLESCAALAGIVKTVECLERGLIPPQMHFENPNPKIDFSNIEIPTRMLQWPPTGSHPRRAAINSFGFGGTNGHVVLEHFPRTQSRSAQGDRPYLFRLSAANDTSLSLMASSHADFVESQQPNIVDLAHTLLARRAFLKRSMFVTASSLEELVGKLRDPATPRVTRSNDAVSRIGFVFTGQGAQWPTMGKQLLEESPVFRSKVMECDRVLQALPDGPDWTALEELAKPKETSRINISSLSQPLCTILQISLLEVWKSWGITPSSVVGHSSGEVAAAYAAGILSLSDAVIVAYYRGLYLGSSSAPSSSEKGGMCAVGLGEAGVQDFLKRFPGKVALAAVNSPGSCTLSGDKDAIEAIVESCKADGVFCRLLKVDMAYHSHHMLPLAPMYEKAMANVGVSPAPSSKANMYSSVYGCRIDPRKCTPTYWKDNMTSTVRFSAAVSDLMLQENVDALVEIGPHPALKGPVADTLADLGTTGIPYFSSCFRGKPDMVALLESAGNMMNANLPVQASRLNANEVARGSGFTYETGRVLTNLPKYEWDHSGSFWAESRISRNLRFRQFPRHELLGSRMVEDTPLTMGWRNNLTLKEVKWLSTIKASGAASLPPTVFLSMAWEAARQVHHLHKLQERIVQLKDITFEDRLPLSWLEDDASVELHFRLNLDRAGAAGTFEISAASADSTENWIKPCAGALAFCEEPTKTPGFHKEVQHSDSLQSYLESFELADIKGVQNLAMNTGAASGQLEQSENPAYNVDPVAFSNLMRVQEMMVLGSGLPGEYNLRSINLVEARLAEASLGTPQFYIDRRQASSVAARMDLWITGSDEAYISLRSMDFQLQEQINPKPRLASLFFRPQVLPDISSENFKAGTAGVPAEMSVSEIMSLLTHKWPNSDVAIVDVEADIAAAVISACPGLRADERSSLRTLTVFGDHDVPESPRVRRVQQLNSKSKFHMIAGAANSLQQWASMLLPAGLLCVRLDSDDERAAFADSFDLVCSLRNLESQSWVVGRLKKVHSDLSGCRPNVFSPEKFDISALSSVLELDHARLPGHTINGAENHSNTTPQHVIVLDCGPESILARESADRWLSWLQSMVEGMQTLLWVNHQVQSDPFSNVAGSFIRTLCAEYPALRAAHLVITDSPSADHTAEMVKQAYTQLQEGSAEAELVAKDGCLQCLRYLPNDQLNASVGIAPPMHSRRQPATGDYRIACAGEHRVAVFSAPPVLPHSLPAGSVVVKNRASLVDHSDVLAFATPSVAHDVKTGFGLFFAGIVTLSSTPEFPSGVPVVGWSPGAHSSSVQVPVRQIHALPNGVSLEHAVYCFAASAIAYAVVNGAARAREGDSFGLSVTGILETAIQKVCETLEVNIVDDSTSADFSVTFEPSKGLAVNSRPVDVRRYLESRSTMSSIVGLFYTLLHSQKSISAVDTFHLSEVQAAFDTGALGPLHSVIVHSGKEMMNDYMVDYVPVPKLFSEDGAYILLGGMGGLGQYLATWMIENGAKNLVTISRSGLSSEDAKRTARSIEELGGQVQAFSVDVSNADALDDAIAQIRTQHRIRGCINLAMVLQDAPFMKMTPERWDRALKLKVEGSWNLHQSTLQDDLDFFILFSSISSITGNRSQSNYATGNAFQNALAAYRRSKGLPGLSIALGSMSGIGVLANDENLLTYCAQMGHAHIGPKELEKVMEAAIFESHKSDCAPLISLGFEMFESLDGVVQKRADQSQAFWTDFPEFSHLIDHKSTGAEEVVRSLKERLQAPGPEGAEVTLMDAFLECLGSLLGYGVDAFDPESSIAVYGLDSLNAMSCRYWFFQQLGLDVPVFDILGCKSIRALISRVITKFQDGQEGSKGYVIPQPVRHTDLQYRPLSHSQRRLWFLHNYLPDKTTYNLLLVCHIEGTVNVPAFKRAWTVLLKRHESLHSRLIDTDEGLQQIPVELDEFPITDVITPSDKYDETVQEITWLARSHEFSLEDAELVRGWLLQSPSGWKFFLTSHHLAWDRSSVPTIFAETMSVYKSLVNGESEESSLKPVDLQFIDYTLWQEECLNAPQFTEPLLAYWSEQLSNIPESSSLLPMALRDTRPVVKELETDNVTFALDSTLGRSIKDFCARHAVTPFMFMTSSLSALVHRLTGDEDVVVGIADGDRGHSAFDDMIGFTVNMLPIRSRTSASEPFISILDGFRKSCLEAYEHRAMPFDVLLSRLEIPRRTSHSPVFQITVNYQMHGAFPEYDYGDFKFTKYDHYNARLQMDLSLSIEEELTGRLDCVFEFDTALYDRQGITSLAEIYKTFIENIVVSDGALPLNQTSIVSTADEVLIKTLLEQPADVTALEECNATLFPVLFQRAVSSHPNKVALVDESRRLTWSEVDAATRKIANELVKSGAEHGEPIGIFCEQSVELVLAAWGIVRAGCAYVPIDPDFPDARILSMMEDVEMTKILVDGGNDRVQRMVACGVKLANIHEIHKMTEAASADEVPLIFHDITKSDPFCCVFTSGSTGRPKGIYIGHGQLRYQQDGYHRIVGTSAEDRILLASAMVFDASLCAIYGAVLHEATLVVASREARFSPSTMIDLIIDQQISNCIMTPTQVSILLAAPNRKKLLEWTSLKSLALGGEAPPQHLLRDLYGLNLPHATFFNAYGPTETTVACSVAKLSPSDVASGSIPLAPPQFPATLYILDDRGNRAPLGVPGELWIGGPAVNNGYIKRPELTQRAFLPDPFSSQPGQIYRTGDLFCLGRDGTLHARGRIGGDRQMKLRGMRIELDEIESALWDLYEDLEEGEAPPLMNLAVAYHKKGDADGMLAAYFAVGEAPVSSSLKQALGSFFRTGLRECLPIHMVPSAFVFVAALPTTVAGKTDYRTISSWPAPARMTVASERKAGDSLQLTALQQGIVKVWRDVLGEEGEICEEDDFFSLGGHSLLLMRVQAGIQSAYGATLSLAAMFAEPTVAGMERLLLAQPEMAGKTNGTSAREDETITTVDWKKEAALPQECNWIITDIPNKPIEAVAMTGASSVIGVHFLHQLLTTTRCMVYCLAEDAPSRKEALEQVNSSLAAHGFIDSLPNGWRDRIIVFCGTLSDAHLGLSAQEIALIDAKVHAIYHMDSEVSLLKNYEGVRAGNVGALHFLINLAYGNGSNVKALHYLSTWGVPHLQAWHGTELNSAKGIVTTETELTHMTPSSDPGLAYLKARWACENLLYEAAHRGLPVTIFRPSMCANSAASGRALKRTDINRRILEGCLQTGLVPDFGSAHGGGMSWITADYLTAVIARLTIRPDGRSYQNSTAKGARIFHVVADRHIPYTELVDVLQTARSGEKLRAAAPEEWFAAMRAAGDPEMAIQAEVLREWWQAGWLPFALDDTRSRRVLEEELGMKPPVVDRKLLLQSVIGEPGF
ncbi:Fusarin C synthetase [Lasiodiplodia hormozganensis]|uniref:Fusarin C synthetase n=1 Tax=Lasiodiplodia hormozganensis TaxID=869390 RepID=A0AA39WCC0_9PEZI|nr:Fusarin C synthetase [Lasiodiplodia hormozganensis]